MENPSLGFTIKDFGLTTESQMLSQFMRAANKELDLLCRVPETFENFNTAWSTTVELLSAPLTLKENGDLPEAKGSWLTG